MRRPASIRPWLSEKQLEAWVRNARNREEYQKRLAIWMTYVGPYPAHQVARLLVVSKQAVWLWVSQYNREGRDGLERGGRGGRHHAILTVAQETALLEDFQKRAQQGDPPRAVQVREELSRATGREVSISYVYRLFDRIGWREFTGPA
jgi:transposase